MSILQSLTRILAFVGAEMIAIIRRPSALVSLVFGPFLIMAIFGLGYQGIRPNVRAIVVIPNSSGLPADTHSYDNQVPGLQVVAVQPSLGSAEQQLRDHAVDAVIIYPADLMDRFNSGQQATIQVEVSIANPNQLVYANDLANRLSTYTNQLLIARFVAGGETVALGKTQIPPNVVAAPMKSEVRNLAPVPAGVVPYFGLAVLILILQHMCITLVALSLMAERNSGIFELYRISPTSAWEIIAGKLIAFMLIGAAIAAASMALLVFGLHVPVLANASAVALIFGLVLVASIGIGLLLGVAADSERTAVQASLLLLLASVFFSGFIIELDLFHPAVQGAANALPATHGITLLQNAALFGSTDGNVAMLALGAIAAVTIVASGLLLRRSMAAIT